MWVASSPRRTARSSGGGRDRRGGPAQGAHHGQLPDLPGLAQYVRAAGAPAALAARLPMPLTAVSGGYSTGIAPETAVISPGPPPRGAEDAPYFGASTIRG